MTDGVAFLLDNVLPIGGVKGPEPVVEGWMPYRWCSTSFGRAGAT